MRVCIRHVRSNHSLQNPKPRDNFSYKCEGHYIICFMMTLIIRGGKKFKYCPVVSIGGCPPHSIWFSKKFVEEKKCFSLNPTQQDDC